MTAQSMESSTLLQNRRDGAGLPGFFRGFLQWPPSLHRTMEWLRLEGTSSGHLVPPPCSSRATQSGFPRTVPGQLSNISMEGDSMTSLGNLCLCSVTLTVKKYFLMFRVNLLGFSLCPLPLVLSLGTAERSLAPSSSHPPSGICKRW